MHPISLFDIAAKQAEWLSVNQKIIAGNVANANTPGFKARTIAPFASMIDRQNSLAMVQTNAAHMDMIQNPLEAQIMKKDSSAETTHSGNTVVLEEEMLRGSETAREMSLNTAIVKSFHQMMMATVQGK